MSLFLLSTTSGENIPEGTSVPIKITGSTLDTSEHLPPLLARFSPTEGLQGRYTGCVRHRTLCFPVRLQVSRDSVGDGGGGH